MPKRGETMSAEQRAKISAAQRQHEPPLSKTCARCKVVRPRDAFRFRTGKQAHLLRAYCRDCERIVQRDKMRKWSEDPAWRARQCRLNRLNTYGLTEDELVALEVRSGGRCEICGGPPDGVKNELCIDHDHETGKVRGLLCGRCNTAIGMMEDDPTRLEAAIAYLVGHSAYDD